MTLLDHLEAIHGGTVPLQLHWLASRVEEACDAVGVDPHTAEQAVNVYTHWLATRGPQG